MWSGKIPARGRLLIVGLTLLIAPAVLLGVTLLILLLGRNILVSNLSLVRIIELYVTKLVLFAILGVLLYRYVERAIEHQLPAAVDDVNRERREREEREPEREEAETPTESGSNQKNRRGSGRQRDRRHDDR